MFATVLDMYVIEWYMRYNNFKFETHNLQSITTEKT